MTELTPSCRKSGSADPRPTTLDAAAIEIGVSPAVRALVSELRIVDQTRSTNDDLLELPSAERHARVLLAERQSAGKGRRGRPWQSPPGNIWMSIGWRFAGPPRALADLPLVAGVCVCRALARTGLRGQRIKRPNDILVDGKKLCGILVETRSGKAHCDSVTGIGLNVRMQADSGTKIDQPWTDLQRELGETLPLREVIVAHLIDEIIARYRDEAGLAGFLAEAWPQWALKVQTA